MNNMLLILGCHGDQLLRLVQLLGSSSVWMLSVLPMPSGSKCAGWVTFCLYIGLCFDKPRRERVEVGGPTGPMRTVGQESCARKASAHLRTTEWSPVHCPYWPRQSTNPLLFLTWFFKTQTCIYTEIHPPCTL